MHTIVALDHNAILVSVNKFVIQQDTPDRVEKLPLTMGQ